MKQLRQESDTSEILFPLGNVTRNADTWEPCGTMQSISTLINNI